MKKTLIQQAIYNILDIEAMNHLNESSKINDVQQQTLINFFFNHFKCWLLYIIIDYKSK